MLLNIIQMEVTDVFLKRKNFQANSLMLSMSIKKIVSEVQNFFLPCKKSL